jgi:hypothetical protein
MPGHFKAQNTKATLRCNLYYQSRSLMPEHLSPHDIDEEVFEKPGAILRY